jgi:hypothetical protein
MAHDDAGDTQCSTLMQFSGEDLDPESISSLIGLAPFSSSRRGDPTARPRPERPTPLARRGVLSYSTHTLKSSDIDDHFRYLLQAIAPVVNEVKSLVDRDHLSWKIVCFFDEAPSDLRAALDPSIASKLDELGIELILDDPTTITVVAEA